MITLTLHEIDGAEIPTNRPELDGRKLRVTFKCAKDRFEKFRPREIRMHDQTGLCVGVVDIQICPLLSGHDCFQFPTSKLLDVLEK